MAIRLRQTGDLSWIALCAAKSDPLKGDVYIDDAQHYALMIKFGYEWNIFRDKPPIADVDIYYEENLLCLEADKLIEIGC